MAMRPIAAVVSASALLLVPQAANAVELPDSVTVPDSVQVPGGGTTVPLPKVEVPQVLPPPPPSKDPHPGGGGGAGQGGGGSAGSPGSRPAGGSPAVADSPVQGRPAGGRPANGTPGRRTPAQGGGANTERSGAVRSNDKQAGASSDSQRGATSTAPGSDEPPAAEQAPVSTAERIFDQVPAGLLTALAVTSLLAAALALIWLRERYKSHHVRRKALRDTLTGIGNRLAFEQQLAREWKRARRYQRPLGVMLLDVDGLKRVNDTDGHGAGDDLLRSVGQRIAEDIREPDLAARLAGDEFVVLCPETGMSALRQLAAKLEEQLERDGIRASIGCGDLREEDTSPEDMVARADEAMYRDKKSRAGRHAEVTGPLGLATAG
jgi:diguanylate cyclase (GGDEF)-like protein